MSEGRPALGPEAGRGSQAGDAAGSGARGAWHRVELGAESSVTLGQRLAGQLSFFRRGWGAEASSGNSAPANVAPTSLEMKGWRGAASGG